MKFKFSGERKWIIFEIGHCSICTWGVETEAIFCTFDYSILWRMLNFIWKVVHRTFGFLFESARPVPVKVICHVKKSRTVSTLRIFEAFVNFLLCFNVIFKTIVNNIIIKNKRILDYLCKFKKITFNNFLFLFR